MCKIQQLSGEPRYYLLKIKRPSSKEPTGAGI